MTDFALEIESPGIFATYKNGVFVNRYRTLDWTGGYLAISSHSNASPRLPHIDRVEVRDGPGGALLYADDFATLADWTIGFEATDGSWSINPASHAHYNRSGGLIYRAIPPGATYFEAKGVYFENAFDIGWVQINVHLADPFTPTDAGAGDDGTGYRCFLEAGDLEVYPRGTLISTGFLTGAVGIG